MARRQRVPNETGREQAAVLLVLMHVLHAAAAAAAGDGRITVVYERAVRGCRIRRRSQSAGACAGTQQQQRHCRRRKGRLRRASLWHYGEAAQPN